MTRRYHPEPRPPARIPPRPANLGSYCWIILMTRIRMTSSARARATESADTATSSDFTPDEFRARSLILGGGAP